MPRTRLHIAKTFGVNSTLQLDAEQARYLTRVLRLRVGDTLSVFDGLGSEFVASITSLGKSTAALLILEETAATTESDLKVHLVQGV